MERDLKRYAPILLKVGVVIALVGFIVAAIYSPPPKKKEIRIKAPEIVRTEMLPPQLQQLATPPPPPKPKIPVAAETEEEVEQETIEETEFTGYEKAPPEVTVEEVPQFVPYDEEPKLLYLPEPEYPELAKKAQIEGVVELLLKIDEKGNVVGVRVAKSVHPLLDQAAIKAAWKAKFKPAKQRDKPVPVMISIKIQFRLTED